MRKRCLHLLLGTAAALSAGCHWHKGPPPFYISRIAASEETLEDNPALGMDAAALKDRLVVALDATGRFVPLAGALDAGLLPKARAYRCHVAVTVTRESDEPTEGAGFAGGRGEAAGRSIPTEGAGFAGGRGEAAGRSIPTEGAGFAGGRGEAAGRSIPTEGAGFAGGRGEAAGRSIPTDAGPVGGTLRRAEVGVSVELSAPGEDVELVPAETSAVRLFDGAAVGGGEEGSPRNNAFRGALDAALAAAAAQLLLELDAVGKTDAQLIVDLSSTDGGVRECAVNQLAERRNPAAVPALIEGLKSSDHLAVMKALGLLEAMHDQRAVKALIDLTEKQDPEFVKQVVYVIGAIGGSDAEAFLYTEENGSQDAQVRAAAAEAAAELRARRAAGDGGAVQAARR